MTKKMLYKSPDCEIVRCDSFAALCVSANVDLNLPEFIDSDDSDYFTF